MLERLYIKNYVIIDELVLNFDRQLNVLTGETGAGKSIIAGALSLILGDRADTSVLINKDAKCIVEATFCVKGNSRMKTLCEEEELDLDEELIIRREINDKGKSRAFVNDTPVVLSTLQKITELMVDLHRQFDQYLMHNGGFEYEVLDAVSDNQEDLKAYQDLFSTYQNHVKQYKETLAQKESWQKESDYKQFLFEELKEADFRENEIEEAEASLQKLSHSEQIKQVLQTIHFHLEEAEPALNNELRSLTQQLESISGVFHPSLELIKRLESARLELKDIAEECHALGENLDLDQEQLLLLQERLDLGNKLLKKHQVQNTEALLLIYQGLSSELSNHLEAEGAIEALEKAMNQAFELVNKMAERLFKNRKKQAPIFSKEINQLLHLIGMPNAEIKIDVMRSDNYSEQGNDKVSFLWDANKSGQFLPVQKSASGGELSRILLCMKALTAEAISLPTLVFDEVDTGISGEAARQVGILLQKLSNRHQVICITHQPQVAGRGDTHFFVYKAMEDKKIKTHVKVLDNAERIQSIARMIGGESPSDAALENAKELVVGR